MEGSRLCFYTLCQHGRHPWSAASLARPMRSAHFWDALSVDCRMLKLL
jgi:hypothetical protein